MRVTARGLQQSLAAWGLDLEVEGRLSGGNRNEVWLVQSGAGHYVARVSIRPVAAVSWEARLLDHLRKEGMRVPAFVQARDGRTMADGVVLMTFLTGSPPASPGDWRLVHETLSRLHALSQGWPQRPGFHSTLDLLQAETGGDVRLDLMPEDAVQRVRAAWEPLHGEALSVVHGDPGAGNILIEGNEVGLIDWDEARIDVSLLDFAAIPLDLEEQMGRDRLRLVRRAAVAWEVANGWVVEPEYARRRLRELVETDWK